MENPFLFVTILVFVFITGLFLNARSASRKQVPTQLDLKAKDSGPLLMDPVLKSHSPENVKAVRIVKEAGTYFNYNDHSWEAHEVLGVSVGAPLQEVTMAYQNSLNSTNPSSHDFLEVAYMSLLKKRKKTDSL